MTDSDRPGHAIQYSRQVDLFRKVRSCSEELVFGISILGFKISNMAASLFNRYIWLVDTIYRAGYISREEIDRRWARSQYNDLHEPGIPDRTFHRHKEAIREIFDIEIRCDRHRGNLYYIANTGQVPGLEKIVAVIRSREISLTLFYQAMSQCKALYKDHSETIMGNMDSIVFLGGREASTLKDISENWLGKATISMQTEGRSRGQSESYSQNMQRLGRELMTTSEITTMPGDKCILQLRGLPPFLSPKYDLKKHPNYKYTAEFDKKKNAFRLESLFRHRPLRLKPEDEYTVYEVDGSDTDEEADLLNFDDLDSDEFV